MDSQKSGAKRNELTSNSDIEVGGDVKNGVVIQGDNNTITLGAKKQVHKRHSHKKNKKPNVVIIAAWIGFAAVIMGSMISLFGNGFFTPKELPGPTASMTGVATETASPLPSHTPTLDPTSTAVLTETALPIVQSTDTLIPPVPIGQDWIKGCISSLWKVYPSNLETSELGNGCLNEPVHVFSTHIGELDFLSQRPTGQAEIYGLFAPLPRTGSVTLTVRLRELENADLWMGVFAEPDVKSQGLLMTILNGDVNRRAIVQKDSQTYVTTQGTIALDQGNGYSITFKFDTLSVISRVNPSVFQTNPFSLPGSQKWLFLGYKGLRGAYSIDGTFLNFVLEQP